MPALRVQIHQVVQDKKRMQHVDCAKTVRDFAGGLEKPSCDDYFNAVADAIDRGREHVDPPVDRDSSRGERPLAAERSC